MARTNRNQIREKLLEILDTSLGGSFKMSSHGPYMRNGYWHCDLDLRAGTSLEIGIYRQLAELDMQINDKFKETITLHLGEVPAQSLAERSEQQLMVAESAAEYK